LAISGIDPLGYIKPEQWLRLVQVAEKGTLDAIFLADEPGLNLGPDGTLPGPPWAALDPLVLLSSLASISTYVGLAATVSSPNGFLQALSTAST
jgi:alkanesulfonate monooxygenase SsuD/methylene tetrahydromethanopterin reductase-like flavin-dependent oxidoreductase (luciferase family)